MPIPLDNRAERADIDCKHKRIAQGDSATERSQAMTHIASRFGEQPELQAKNIQQHDASAIAANSTRTTADVKSASALASATALDWRAERMPLQLADGRPVSTHVGIVRSDTRAQIGIVGSDYGIIQPQDMTELADAILQADGYTRGNAGVLRGGSRAFLQLKSDKRDVGGVAIQSNITVFNSWDGSLRFEAGFADTVIVCRNTLQAALGEAASGISIRHTTSAPERVKQATRILEASKEYRGALDNAILRMMAQPLSTDQLMALVQQLLPADGEGKVSARTEKARQAVLSAYTQAPGAAPGSAWGAVQAVSYYATHTYPVRKTSGRSEAEARAEGTWFGPGGALMRKAWTNVQKPERLVYVAQR